MQMNRQSHTTNPAGGLKILKGVPRDYAQESYSREDETTPFEDFEDLAAKLLKVPKEEVDEKLAEREREKKRPE